MCWLVGARRMNPLRRAANSATTARKLLGSVWMVRMMGMASADQEEIWNVLGGASGAILGSQARALEMARASLYQSSSSGVIVARARVISGQMWRRQMPWI